MVEKALVADRAIGYPRCTGGERAGPPEGCGGVDAYQNLVDAFDNQAHTYYRRLLDWNRHHGEALKPGDFDVDDVNEQLKGR